MNKKPLLLGLAALLVTLATGVSANDIYKWTDENGNVHYGDRPTGAPTEEQLKVSTSRTDPEALAARKQSFAESEQARKDARAQAEEDRRQAEEDRMAAEEKQQECAEHRDRLSKMKVAPRVYRTDENGERIYLDDVQRAESIAKAEEYINSNCAA